MFVLEPAFGIIKFRKRGKEGDGMKKKYGYILPIVLLLVNASVIVSGISFFWGGQDFSLNQKRDSLLFGASYMTMNNEFYKIISEEITYRVEAEGDRMVLRDPALSVERQIEQIQEMLDMGMTPIQMQDLREQKQGELTPALFETCVHCPGATSACSPTPRCLPNDLLASF